MTDVVTRFWLVVETVAGIPGFLLTVLVWSRMRGAL